MEVLNRFKYGVEHYRKKNWEVAKEAFNSSLELNPNDTLSKIYIKRCNYLNDNPPEDGWDGVWLMTEK